MSTCANDNYQSEQMDDGEVLLDSLPFPAQFLIWGMRSWVTALKSGKGFAEISGDGFTQFGLGAAGQSLDEVFRIVAVAASRPIDIRCVKCRRISEDEILLLETVAAGQSGKVNLVYAGLAELLPPAAVRNAFPSLLSLAKLFAHAGLALSLSRPVAKPIKGAAMERATPDDTGLQSGQRPSLLQQAGARLSSHDMPALIH